MEGKGARNLRQIDNLFEIAFLAYLCSNLKTAPTVRLWSKKIKIEIMIHIRIII